MQNVDDRLLKMSREELEEEARSMGLAVTKEMSKAELVILIERQRAMQELDELQPINEFRLLLAGILSITVAAFVLALDTFHELATGHYWNPIASLLIPIYLTLRSIGGFLMAAGFFSLALKNRARSITPVIRAICIIGGLVVILVVVLLVPLPYQWSSP